MKVKVSSNNQIVYIPKFQDNHKLAKTKQFKVVLKRTSSFVMGNETVGANSRIDMVEYLKKSIVDFQNNIMLEIDEKTDREMSVDDLINMPELSDLAQEIFAEAVRINTDVINRKKF